MEFKANEQDIATTSNKIDNLFSSLNSNKKKWKLNDFNIASQLGKGNFGKVHLAREKHYDITVALKIVNKSMFKDKNAKKQLYEEINLQSQLKHNNILRLYNHFEDEKNIYFILEYALNGELYSLLKKERKFSEKKTATYIYQIANALHYCHSKNIIHRDIKAENILIDNNDNLKLADFGLSVQTSDKRRTMCGTIDYMAPEIIKNYYYYKEIDNWAVGVLCFELLTGKTPFFALTRDETCLKIVNNNYKLPSYLSNNAQNLIQNLLKTEPNKRLNFKNVINHAWIKNVNNLSNTVIFDVDEEEEATIEQNNSNNNNDCYFPDWNI